MSKKENSKTSTANWKAYFLSRLLSLLLIASILSAATFAWLAMNGQTGSNDMRMRISVSPNLVVSVSSSAIANYTTEGWANSYIENSWSDDAEELIPVDHYDSDTYPVVSGDNYFNLVYNSNPENVVRNTGKGTNLTYAHVPQDGVNVYFIDKVIYIASLSREMVKDEDYSSITFSIVEIGSGTSTNISYKSASVDVYVAGVFKGTLNLDTLNTFSISDVSSIPLNTSGSLEITFRCYFDGALQNANDNTKNYVNSTMLATNTADIAFDISIVAD